MKRKEANKLLHKYLEGTCTVSERKLVEAWLDHRTHSKQWCWKSEEQALYTKVKMKYRITQTLSKSKLSRQKALSWSALAATLLISIGIGTYFWKMQQREEVQRLVVAQDIGEVVDPGAESAMLTLGDGSIIRLDDALEEGFLMHNGDGSVGKVVGGQLVYESGDGVDNIDVDTNQMTIPLGGLFQVTLSDGTNVWLNSASILTYPTRFTGAERIVRLVGEAYFEVSRNETQPFKVLAGDVEVAVTGTHFNVSAYPEERYTSTTLLEGGVSVRKKTSQIHLVPGQQAFSIRDVDKLERKQVDAVSSIAWRNGYFVFDDQDIASVLREVARWYNVDIYIQGNIQNAKKIGGVFSRTRSLGELLHFLERLNVATFQQKGRRITAMI